MSLIETAANLFAEQSGYDLDPSDVGNALGELLPSDENGELDIGTLIGKFTSEEGGLANMASSWLGDGENMSFGVSDLVNMFGESQIRNFADNLGIDVDDAQNTLANIIPNLIDNSSEGGSLIGDIGGGLVKNLMGRFF